MIKKKEFLSFFLKKLTKNYKIKYKYHEKTKNFMYNKGELYNNKMIV